MELDNPSDNVLLWLAVFVIGWAVFMHLPTIFSTVTGGTMTIIQGGVFIMIMFALVKLMANVSELLS